MIAGAVYAIRRIVAIAEAGIDTGSMRSKILTGAAFLLVIVTGAVAHASGKVDGDLGDQIGAGPKICPRADGIGRQFNARSLKGKTLDAARAIAKPHGCSVRVVKKNGKSFFISADLRFDRINVFIEGEKRWIVRVHGTY